MTKPLTLDGRKVEPALFHLEYRTAVIETIGRATTDDWASGLDWYAAASVSAANVASAAGRSGDVEYGADLLAILSPAVNWEHNQTVALDVALGLTAEEISYQGYGNFLERAIAYRINPSRALVRGPKVRPFADTIADPWNGALPAVIDRHMVGIAEWTRPKNIENVGVRAVMASAVSSAADWFGLLTSQAQAIAWAVVRPAPALTARDLLPIPWAA